jgi:hypothetical protein
MTRPVALASWVATLVVLAGAVAAFAASWLMTPTPDDPARVAAAVLQAAGNAPDPGAAQAAVLRVLPDGAAALVDLPGVREGDSYAIGPLTVVHGVPLRIQQLGVLAAKHGSLAVDEGFGGTWVAVAVPPPLSRPFPAALAAAVVTALTGAAAVVAALLLAGRRRSTADGGSPPPAESANSQLPQLLDQRERLVCGLAELVGALPAEFQWRAARVLESADVQRVLPDGQAFDPAVHHAVGTEPTPDSARADTVARTLQAGWIDSGRVLVPARVVVFVAAVQPGVPP